ncbi:MAG TPA: hypothetical protein VFC68_05545 [Treponemataceae bacterium]|nr:hypothetical protein [Treponemataceae bacterium]
MKKCLFILFISLFCFEIPLTANQISYTSDIHVIKTEHFDFIFPTESTKTAESLALVAENYYTEITEKLSVPTMNLHLPVVITPETDQINGYYTAAPYNRIVLFDTAVFTPSLQVFEQTMRSVFYHELTHAISLNIRSPVWEDAAAIIGDIVSPAGFLNNPLSFLEGVTVSFESTNGQGRMNNAFSTHIIKQAKIDGCFPSLYDITGARDTYPSGNLPYIFGGAFSQFLQNTYGREKYAEFWKESGKFHFLKVYPGILKKVYGKEAHVLWDEFYNSIVVPENLLIPENAITQQKIASSSSILHKAKPMFFANLCSAQTAECGPLFIWQDLVTGSVYGALKKTSNDPYVSQKLCSTILTERISISKNAQYLAVSGYTQDEKPKSIAKIYNVTGFGSKIKADFTGITLPGLRDVAVIGIPQNTMHEQKNTEGDEFYVTGIETKSQDSALLVYTVNTDKNTITKQAQLNCGVDQLILKPADAGDGKILFLLKEKLNWSIGLYTIQTKKTVVFKTNLHVRDMSVSGDTILLSCAEKTKNAYPFYASIKTSDLIHASEEVETHGWCGDSVIEPLWAKDKKPAGTAYIALFTMPYSAGVYEPVLCGENDIFYVSRFFDNWQLSIVSPRDKYDKQITENSIDKKITRKANNDGAIKQSGLVKIPIKAKEGIFVKASQSVQSANSFTIEQYKPMSYVKKGIFIPFGGINLNPTLYSTNYIMLPRLGGTWLSMDPTERVRMLAGGGYDFILKKITANMSAQSCNAYNNWAVDSIIEINLNGFEGGGVSVQASSIMPIGLTNFSLRAENDTHWYYGNKIILDTINSSSKGNHLATTTVLGINWSKKTGVSVFDYVSATATVVSGAYYDVSSKQGDYLISTEYTIHIPQLLPFTSPKNLTLNVPLDLSVIYNLPIGVHKTPLEGMLFSWETNMVLFSAEIQKGIPYIHMFPRRFVLDGGVSGYMSTSGPQGIKLYSSLFFKTLYNTGILASSNIDANLGVKVVYDTMKDDQKVAFSFKFGFLY